MNPKTKSQTNLSFQKERVLRKKIFRETVFFTKVGKKVDECHVVPKKHLKEILKKYRKVYLELRICRKLLKEENRCNVFKRNCKRCIIDYWEKKTLNLGDNP